MSEYDLSPSQEAYYAAREQARLRIKALRAKLVKRHADLVEYIDLLIAEAK